MKVSIYQVDAFTKKVFGGNSAAICPLDKWLPEDLMQRIAMENNLAETAYIVKEDEGFRIRWFTPTVEVDLCGHATLASAHVFFNHLQYPSQEIVFNSKSGPLRVLKGESGKLTLDFPKDQYEKTDDPPAELHEGLGINIVEVIKGSTDFLVITDSQKNIERIVPDLRTIAKIKSRGVIVSARGEDVDFVSRCFFPQSGIDEDPVTGSAHTLLTPYWAQILGKNKLTAQQLSGRKGELECELSGNRVLISGYAATYMLGVAELPG
ncbi:MAG: isomerase [Bacteroidetes bacterium]|nr:MAG: isomerase [Bacteroidota bacterium]